MTQNTLYLFPDTNVFIQCKPLEQLNWSEWRDFAEVHLLVSQPVQKEIDDQKHRGNNRVANKARSTYQMFRKIIDGRQEFELVRSLNPVVKVFLQGPSRPSTELEDTLDYNKPDDRIVGCLHKFLQDNPGADARLLTYDAGPMMTANSLGLPYVAVKEEWILPPENNDMERENARLKEQITRLQRTSPQFTIEMVNGEGQTIDRLDMDQIIYEPLSEDDIETLLTLLTTRFPKATDFGSLDPARNSHYPSIGGSLAHMGSYIPASEEEINRYRNSGYPGWLRACREALSAFHEKLQERDGDSEFTFSISNDGTRPAKDALLNIIAEGNLQIYVPIYVPESEKPIEQEPILPSPPTPPRGRWRSLHDLVNRSANLDGILRNPFLLNPSILDKDRRRDPNGFYYKPNRPTTPGDLISLECEQWRHGTGPEHFSGHISVDPDGDVVRGALTCEIHAENLTEPVEKTIPVRINIKRIQPVERARRLVQELGFQQPSGRSK